MVMLTTCDLLPHFFLFFRKAAEVRLATWKQATVQFNYHISVDKMQYSVPYECIRHKVDVRLTKNTIEVFYRNIRICSHMRLYGRPGQYSSIEAHMPEDHQKCLKWDKGRFIAWAGKIGPNTVIAIKSLTPIRLNSRVIRAVWAF